jgi:hypothetical protein
VKYRLLTILPLAAAVLLAIVDGATHDHVSIYAWLVPLVKAIAAAGAMAAAMRFQRGDYLRLAWVLTASCYALLLLKDVLFGTGSRLLHPFSDSVAWLRGAITLLANAAGVIGAWLLARAWQVAGILLPGSRATQRMVFGAGLLLALAIAGRATLLDMRGLAAGDPQLLVQVASDLGDILSLCLIAPVLLTAIALRGGLLAWPWALTAAAGVSWLFYDAVGNFAAGSANGVALRTVEEVFRLLACGFTCASGIAQRWVMRDMRSASRRRRLHPA